MVVKGRVSTQRGENALMQTHMGVVSGISTVGDEWSPVAAFTTTGILQTCGDLCVAAPTGSESVLWEALLHQRPCRCCSSRLLNGPTSTRYQVSSFTVPDSTFTA